MSDLENEWENDHEVSKDHSKLLEEVSKLDKGQRVKKPERSEPSIHVSEFHLVKSGVTDSEAVNLHDLITPLQKKPNHRDITNKVKSIRNKTKTLPKPLEKPQAEKLKRAVGFANARQELQKWDPIITRHRVAEKLTFPLRQDKVDLKKPTTDELAKRFRIQSDLAKELAALEPEKPEEEEKKDEFPLTLGEILQRRREAAKFRAQQSYREAKAHRRNKIKSKKFHRIERKAKIKQQIAEFEKLQKTNPDAALEKLAELDKARAEERMSLRHKSTGQWARNKQVRAKYDTESRKVLAQQLSISRDLTQKVKRNEDSDEDDGDDEAIRVDGDNPWVNPMKTESEIDDFVTGYRKFWEEKNKKLQEKKSDDKSEENKETDKDKSEEGVKIIDFNIPQSLNPVEDVIEEYEKDENSEEDSPTKVKNKTKNIENLSPNTKQSKKNNKLATKAKKSNETTKVKVSKLIPIKSKTQFTTEWGVETFPVIKTSSKKAPVEIDEMFDKMEEKLKQKMKKKMKTVKYKLTKLSKHAEREEDDDKEEDSDEELPDLSMKKTKLRPEFNEPLDETAGGVEDGNAKIKNTISLNGNSILNGDSVQQKGVKRPADIDPNKFIAVKPKHLKTQLPDDVMGTVDALDDNDDDEAQHNIISEAFADDDVVDEFRREKEDEIKKDQPDDLDLRLPGWGSWGGKNIKQSLRKKRRFILKFPKEAPRKDQNKGDVIIVEDAVPEVKSHLVAELPYPFTSVADYEASIRAPIGRDFVPENAHKRLTDPSIKTKMGAIIEPMDDDVLLKKKNIKFQGKMPEKRESPKGKAKDKKFVKNVNKINKKKKNQ